eukprot:TRINITY_DN8192_c0_g1_i1.p1 TRINITY_DN8192_c0_g1~~TRINITY_DN8192_c0_g1_i1.p1  ORF type:complete len:296 (+),score=41.94 TRINITY_DN8192_c0_g1_i1:60-947(+)
MAVAGIQIASDIHLEMFKSYENVTLPVPKSPVLALLGDIGYPLSDIFQEFISDMCSKFRHVIMVSGNHEYYTSDIETVEARLRLFEKELPNFKYLQQGSIELDIIPGYRIVGCTLWVDFCEADQYCAHMCINDYTHVSVIDGDAKRKLTTQDTQKLHASHFKFIQNEIENSDKPLIILTHHAPTAYKCISVEESEQNDVIYRMNFTHLERFMSNKIAAWLFGHTHENVDVIVKSGADEFTRIATNQQGYVPFAGFSKRYQLTKEITFPVSPSDCPDIEVVTGFDQLYTRHPEKMS